MQKPSIGRIVHYLNYNKDRYAAIITAVHEGLRVSLTVFFPTGESNYAAVDFSQEDRADSWQWPVITNG